MAMRSVFATPEFRQESLVQEWLSCSSQGKLLAALKHHWKTFVLCVYGNNNDQAKENRLANKFLFRPLEYFLCNGDPDKVFQELKDKDTPSQLCGRVFKTGEPTYSCRDCANDPTCVLCIDCFQKSDHRKHRYRMSTSGGGGYCDCGDVEAWKVSPFCDLHKADSTSADEQNPIELLPDDLTDRASALFMAALHYAVEMLIWEHCDNLPQDLQPEGELHDTYVTMLFNDEVHTYEQVINTLQKAVDCNHKEAVDFATTVDREGRSNVLCDNFAHCEKARHIIEHSTSRHGSKPLKVNVMHTIVVAHQAFALRMIIWLQNIIGKSDGLRRLFCLLSTQPQEDGTSLMEKLLLHDTQLWKVARVHSHQLLMAGVLLDLECKKQFAVIFTKRYPQVMHAFAQDDHDHDVCVASLSVQIFTVPSLHYAMLVKDFMLDDHYRPVSITSLSVQIFTVGSVARMLVTEHDLLTVIMKAFLNACEEKRTNDGKLAFDRSEKSPTFKRACFMLYDLKYTLICKPSPSDWNDKLRQNFLSGLRSFLTLLKMMQGMDAVIRQTGLHLEYEPEWEGAFNLQLKQDDVITEFLEWCGTDKKVLIEAYKITLEFLLLCKDKPATVTVENCTVAQHTARCLKYDVSVQPVSIHLPLTRFLAGLHVHLGKFNLSLACPELNAQIDPVELIEPPLRVQVMIAQTQAGMWRRNGYALLNQIFFYHNVKCRREMYDKDIIMLQWSFNTSLNYEMLVLIKLDVIFRQIGAAALDPNEFLIHLLNKFGLLTWIRVEYDTPTGQDDLVRQTIVLAEEFLHLLIIIIGERFVPGVGDVITDDVIKREIIHQLCISPMAHSELAKGLPENENNETGIESVISDVATFKKPAITTFGGKGKFELKAECYEKYNSCFYHYSRAEQSKAEEAQLKRKKAEKGEHLALPPPVPPKFTEVFKTILPVLHSDLMIHIMHLVLQRSVAVRSRSWSETQLDRVLHLIGLALHEQKQSVIEGNHSFNFVAKATTDKKNLFALIESLIAGPNNITHESTKDLLTWILKKFIEVRQMTNSPVNTDTMEQISASTKQESEVAKKKKAKIAAKRREKIMAQFSNMQKNFIRDNADLFETTDTEKDAGLTRVSSDMDISEVRGVESPVALGNKKSSPTSIGLTKAVCILCQEEQDITHRGHAMVLAGFIQRSTVMSQCRSKVMNGGENHDPLIMPADLNTGTFTGSCGHAMHADCWQSFFDAILQKERRRPLRYRPNLSFNIDNLEFLCPLCESLSNTVIPLIPPMHTLITEREKPDFDLSFNDWLDGLHRTVKTCVTVKKVNSDTALSFQPCSVTTVTKTMAENVATNFQLLWKLVHGNSSNHFAQGVLDMLRKFAKDVYSFGLAVDPDDINPRVPIMAWNTCAFTIQNMEQMLRDEGKPLFGVVPSRTSDCVNALVKFAAVCGQISSVNMIKQHCLRLLSVLLPDATEHKTKDPLCILDIDMFHYLTSLTMTLPILYAEGQRLSLSSVPSGGLNEKHALELAMTVHVIQIMLTCDITPLQGAMEVENDSEGIALLQVYKNIRQMAGIHSEQHPLPWQLLQHIKSACLPFLRCATVLFHNLTGVPVPPSFSESMQADIEPFCKYLSLPTHLSHLFLHIGPVFDSLLNKWCSCDILKGRLSASSEKLVTYPLPVNHLIDLPDDYSQLINQVSTFTCPKSNGDDSRAPTMCLVCGTMLCSQSYCCQTEIDKVKVGAATEHTFKCGAGVGVFLRVRECQILLLAGRTKGCFVSPPYLDTYGETDQGLRRGNPLHLCSESYRSLQKLWFSHCVPETIAHSLETNTSLLNIDWQHL